MTEPKSRAKPYLRRHLIGSVRRRRAVFQPDLKLGPSLSRKAGTPRQRRTSRRVSVTVLA